MCVLVVVSVMDQQPGQDEPCFLPNDSRESLHYLHINKWIKLFTAVIYTLFTTSKPKGDYKGLMMRYISSYHTMLCVFTKKGLSIYLGVCPKTVYMATCKTDSRFNWWGQFVGSSATSLLPQFDPAVEAGQSVQFCDQPFTIAMLSIGTSSSLLI